MLFFDFLFYSIAKLYRDYSEKGAESSAAAIVGGLQAFNILTILISLCLIQETKDYLNKMAIVIIIILFQVTTYIRYVYRERHGFDSTERKWLEKSEPSRKTLRFFLVLYTIASVVVGIGLAIFLGTKDF